MPPQLPNIANCPKKRAQSPPPNVELKKSADLPPDPQSNRISVSTSKSTSVVPPPTSSALPQSTTTAPDKMPPYRSKVRVLEKYHIIGFISSGTYGRVYKARSRTPGNMQEFAIKKFKPDKEGEVVQYTGISQSACREMALCSELSHPNVIALHEIILEDKCIYMVFSYAEHDLLQIIHHHSSSPTRPPIPAATIKSILWQLLNGVAYLHQNWVLHRDLKPANIMVTRSGELKIGDLGLARLFYKPLQSLYTGDKVVVTIWYRAPELLLGSKHYTAAIDLWAVGCIFAELLALRPIFKGEEAKMEKKSTVPFQRNQMQKIIEILGTPRKEDWPELTSMPEYSQLPMLKTCPDMLETWWMSVTDGPAAAGGRSFQGFSGSGGTAAGGGLQNTKAGLELLKGLLTYDPMKRWTAQRALESPFFKEGTRVSLHAFDSHENQYPNRRVTQDDNDLSLPGTKRSGLPDDSFAGRAPPVKRVKEN